jgi:hypothetical protein
MQSCYELLFINDQLLHIVQKEKIAPKIAAKMGLYSYIEAWVFTPK